MFYKPGEQVQFTFVIPDSAGDNISGLTWSIISFSKAGVRVGTGTEYDSIGITEDASNEFYLFVMTPSSSTRVSMNISAKCSGANPEHFEITLEPVDRMAEGFLDAVDGIETGMTMREAMRGLAAVLLGKLAVSGTTVTFKDVNDVASRVVATVDTSGNRTAVTLTLT